MKHETSSIAVLTQLLQQQQEQNASLMQVNQQLQQLIEKLQHQVEELLRKLYGKKSEKKVPTSVPPDDVPALPTSSPPKTAQTPTDKKGARLNSRTRAIINNLPLEQIEYTLTESERVCPECKQLRCKIGECRAEQLDFIPAKLVLKAHVRFKYACQRCKGQVVCAPMPNQPIDKGLAGPGLLAEVLISKYQDALPLYRQEQRFKRLGIELSRKTLCDWVQAGAFWLKALVDEMQKDFLHYQTLHSDDTVYPVLSKGKTHQGRLWVYLARQAHKPLICLYQYTKTRAQIHPQTFLKDFRGYLQADAYVGYDKIYDSGQVIEVGCMAHARRKFFEVAEKIQAPSLAHTALEWIRQLYAIEAHSQHLNICERYYYRRRYAKPLLKQFYRFLHENQAKTLPQSPIGKAIRYAHNHWKALCNYLRHGDLHIDNNAAERAIKPFVIGRKNFLFSATHEGAENAAILYSIIETCKLNGVNTFDYLKDIFTRIPNLKSNQIRELLPYCWKQNPS